MNAVIFGASGGIGRALVQACVSENRYNTVFAASRSGAVIDGAMPLTIDGANEDSLEDIAKQVAAAGPLALCVVSIGLLSDGDELQPEKSLKQQSEANFERVFHANTIVPALIAKHMLPILSRKDRTVFAALSARVGSISDNRLGGWHAYRASKAALNMLIKTYSIEMRLRNPDAIIAALHPGTVDTTLSQPFQKTATKRTLFKPEEAARNLLDVVAGLTPQDSGHHFDWAGIQIAP